MGGPSCKRSAPRSATVSTRGASLSTGPSAPWGLTAGPTPSGPGPLPKNPLIIATAIRDMSALFPESFRQSRHTGAGFQEKEGLHTGKNLTCRPAFAKSRLSNWSSGLGRVWGSKGLPVSRDRRATRISARSCERPVNPEKVRVCFRWRGKNCLT